MSGGCFDEVAESKSQRGHGSPQSGFVKVQIQNADGLSWVSECLESGSSIRVEKRMKPQFWRMKRDTTDPLWSFYVPDVGPRRLYATYTKGNPEATSEFRYDRNLQSFHILLSNKKDYFLIKVPGKEKYLQLVDGKLHVEGPSADRKSMLWKLEGVAVHHIQMNVKHQSKKWISQVEQDDPIPVRQASREELWDYHCDTNKFGFSTKNISNQEIFVAYSEDDDEIIMKPPTETLELRQFGWKEAKLFTFTGTKRYLTISSGGVLQLTNSLQLAQEWEPIVDRIIDAQCPCHFVAVKNPRGKDVGGKVAENDSQN